MTRTNTLRKFTSCLGAGALFIAMASGPAFAASSGNFSATGTSASCQIGAGGSFGTSGTTLSEFDANISTSSGNGVTLDVRPDLVTGLFTDTKISTTVPSASAEVGIQVCVTVDGKGTGVLPTSCVIYDERFQQISTSLFGILTECTSTTACSPTVPCAAPLTCSSSTGPGVCINTACNFELILSTLSAHSFDFIVPGLSTGNHVVAATWSVIGSPNSSAIGCVGPGVLTVTQMHVFKNSGALDFSDL